MELRRIIGAILMMLGAAMILATLAGGTVLAVSYVKTGALDAPFGLVASVAAAGLFGGVIVMLLGRLIYGKWSRAAPIANFTADVARLIGLSVAFGLGAMLVFLFVTGFKPDDILAALVLGAGVIAGIVLAYIGRNIRGSGRSYLD